MKKHEEEHTKMMIYVPKNLMKRFRHRCVDEETSMASMLRRLIAEYMGKEEKCT